MLGELWNNKKKRVLNFFYELVCFGRACSIHFVFDYHRLKFFAEFLQYYPYPIRAISDS